MSNPVTIKVGSASYSVLTDDNPGRIARAAAELDRRVCAYLTDGRITTACRGGAFGG
jgi:cell division protein ZapA (FtsZ GTPase activity inhibitor)